MSLARSARFIAGVSAALCVAGSASASFSTATYASTPGVEGLGAYTAQVSFSYTSGNTASVTIAVTNTSNAANGGYLTALAVTGSTGISAVYCNGCDDLNFGELNGPVSASPFGDFMAGFSTSSSWTGGGSPSLGLGIGQSASFSFLLQGTESALSVMTAATAFSPTSGYGMAARFRGFNNGGSDKVLAYVIPGPGSLAVLAVAAACSRGRRRR